MTLRDHGSSLAPFDRTSIFERPLEGLRLARSRSTLNVCHSSEQQTFLMGTGSAENGTGLTLAAFPRMLGLADLRTDIRYYLV